MIELEKGKVYRKKIPNTKHKYFWMLILSDVQKDESGETFVYCDTWDSKQQEWCGAKSPFYLREDTLIGVELDSSETDKEG